MVKIPPRKECLQLMEDMHMPAHIQAHSIMVCRVALVLANGLISAGLKLDRELIRAAAILHDITKHRSFNTGEHHAQTGGEYLTELGFYEVGEIIRQHVILDAYPENQSPCEAEVVNYADKRVLHDRIVPLDQRMEYIRDHYAKTHAHRELLMVLWQHTQMLENRLFHYLNFAPENLAEHSENHQEP